MEFKKLNGVKIHIGSRECKTNIQFREDCNGPGIIATSRAQTA
ncbi:MAG: hypothetical protein NTW17_02890 [Candidatus Pacearchaeota archaeon]|nr:hypothetical protein [Candidatus Pacearchaeota archaeon]